ncbi:hypothetical protein D9619_004731 [Psilocybe cf. subviscida]|uniref:Uncharacterized protein n=1 Tax=Psilocybe cf. subviscida TaxID=2480587 RepID=A0A8H5BQJ5_9AGAR|nr:hypothetical protein D9619_004731 [Psilocybe cf. subviscida]
MRKPANETTGMISVDICTSGNEKLGTFLFQRQSEEFIQSKGMNASLLTKKERKAHNRLKELKKSRDLIDDQIKAAEEHLDRLKEEKLARRRGIRSTETGPSTSDDQAASGAPGIVSNQVGTGSSGGGQSVQDPEVATDIAMGDAEGEEGMKMDDGESMSVLLDNATQDDEFLRDKGAIGHAAVKEKKSRRRRRPIAVDLATPGEQAPEVPAVVDQENVGQAGQKAREVKGATNFEMGDVEIKENVKMADD